MVEAVINTKMQHLLLLLGVAGIGGVQVVLPYIGSKDIQNPERGFVSRCPLMEGRLSMFMLGRSDGVFARQTGVPVAPTLCNARILLDSHADGSPITQSELDEVRPNSQHQHATS